MATIYQRLIYNKINLSPEKRHKLGAYIHRLYAKNHLLTGALAMATSHEENGTFKVFSYPKKFTPIMDGLIKDFILLQSENLTPNNPPKKERKRIPLKNK
jgi:hypothetical protein